MKTAFTFQSNAFNTTPRDYFMNPACFGDDVALWLISQLRVNGCAVDEQPEQEDFGWYVRFDVGGTKHDVVVGYRPDDESWICWIERSGGPFGAAFGKRKQVAPEVVDIIQRILSASPEICGLRLCSEEEL